MLQKIRLFNHNKNQINYTHKPEVISCFLEQHDWTFQSRVVPLSVAIFAAELRHQRISTTIGAKKYVLLFQISFKAQVIKRKFANYLNHKHFQNLNTYKVKKKTLQERLQQNSFSLLDLQGFQNLAGLTLNQL